MPAYENFLNKVESGLNNFEGRSFRCNYIPIVTYFTGSALVLAGIAQGISGTVVATFFHLQYRVNRNNSQALARGQYSFKHAKHGFKNTVEALLITLFTTIITPLMICPLCWVFPMMAANTPPNTFYPLSKKILKLQTN